MDLVGSESSILWLRSESSAGVEGLGEGSRVFATGTGLQEARTGAVGTEVEITGSGVLGGGVGGGAGAFRFFSWLYEDGELKFIYGGREDKCKCLNVWYFRVVQGVAMWLIRYTECFFLLMSLLKCCMGVAYYLLLTLSVYAWDKHAFDASVSNLSTIQVQ